MSIDVGYPDYQRVVNWDSPVLYQGDLQIITSYVQSNPIDVSRYAYLGGFINLTAGQCLISIQWFLDDKLQTLVGERQFRLDAGINNICQPKIIHMGPWVQITLQTINNAQFTVGWSLFATNRTSALDFVPQESVLIDRQGEAYNASQTITHYPTAYYSGPARIFASASEAFTISALWLGDLGNYDYFWQDLTVASNNFNADVIVPAGAWVINATNNGSSTTDLTLSVISSGTGSS